MTLLSTSIRKGIALFFANGVNTISLTPHEKSFKEDNSVTAIRKKRSSLKKKLSQSFGKINDQPPQKNLTTEKKVISPKLTYGSSSLEVKTEKPNSESSKVLEENIKTLIILNKYEDTPENCNFEGFNLILKNQFDEQEVVIKPLSKFKLISKEENVLKTLKIEKEQKQIQVNVLTFEIVCDEPDNIVKVEKNINIY